MYYHKPALHPLLLHRRWWHPKRKFVFKRRPNCRPLGHPALRHGAKLVASVFFYCSSFKNCSFCRGRAYSLSFAAFLAASVLRSRVIRSNRLRSHKLPCAIWHPFKCAWSLKQGVYTCQAALGGRIFFLSET